MDITKIEQGSRTKERKMVAFFRKIPSKTTGGDPELFFLGEYPYTMEHEIEQLCNVKD